MKLDNPRKTSSGCVHQTSARIVWPNERRGTLTSAPFICRQLLQLRNLPFSTLPNSPAHSKDCRNLPPSKYLQQCSRDNRFRSKPQLALRDPVHRLAFAALAKKCDAHRERVRSSIRAANEHRQFASSLPVDSVHAHPSA